MVARIRKKKPVQEEEQDGGDHSGEEADEVGVLPDAWAARQARKLDEEAHAVFSLFDNDQRGAIGQRELGFALARLGQHPTKVELDAIVAKFDTTGDGVIDFDEFRAMMDALAGSDREVRDEDDLKGLAKISYYGQASICRWLEDDHAKGDDSGDVTGPDVPYVQRKSRQLALVKPFEQLMYTCIVVAAVISGLQSYRVDSEFEGALWCTIVDSCILVLFTIEVSVKFFAENRHYPLHFFEDSWNIFDLLVCASLLASAALSASGEVAPFRLVRLLRAIRLLRTVRLFPNLAVVIETTVKSASSVVYIGMFMVLFTYMFAIVGVTTFGRNDPFYFGNLGRAMITLFRIITMDSWSMIMYYNMWGCGDFEGPDGAHRGYGDYESETGMTCEHTPNGMFAALYFVFFICCCGFLVLNLFIGIITTEMQTAKEEAEKTDTQKHKLMLAMRATDLVNLDLDLDGAPSVEAKHKKGKPQRSHREVEFDDPGAETENPVQNVDGQGAK